MPKLHIIHKWNGCKCVKCGTVRNEYHDWTENTCQGVCRICGKKHPGGHSDYISNCQMICRYCGRISGERHDWKDGVCRSCGKKCEHNWVDEEMSGESLCLIVPGGLCPNECHNYYSDGCVYSTVTVKRCTICNSIMWEGNEY